MRVSTKEQRGAIGAMAAKMRLSKDEKQALVYSFSDERTTTTTELYFDEASDLIKHLKIVLELPDTAKDVMTNKILSIAHEMRWEILGKIDMSRVNNWCLKYGQFHKKLDDHLENELPALITQFEKVHLDYLKGI